MKQGKIHMRLKEGEWRLSVVEKNNIQGRFMYENG